MSQVATQPLSGTYRAQPAPSTVAFAVRHSGAFWFRGSLSEVAATLRADDHGLVLEGSADVESISVAERAAMRASVLGPEFFDAEQHPKISFRSTELRLDNDGGLQLDGELTMKGITRPVAATGHHAGPRPAAFGEIAGLELRTTIDRRDFGFEWQMKRPDGRDAIGWEVQIDIDLLLIREDANADD
jgi:polyisoprenoid-binding protein YceI